ncbi:DUF3107 domain-containing protein [Nocardioides acrostichi]|uniref:DUF3107 domain-containing protein n=1 Tax=Nocardioides acrostichi TaxID=2784339 RepID=A0A930UTR9_9ACTN|nr:DUF3107 domain-containing protein [Nocardioides acrostichi]MBF4160678.1 DUF3107 domain-containing protein [Nocardioides acrostichi]
MEIKIGIQQAPRELSVDADIATDDLHQQIAEAVSSGGLLSLTDTKGRTIVVPGGKIAYIEVGSTAVGTVGFRS